jgi:hypothetical protein
MHILLLLLYMHVNTNTNTIIYNLYIYIYIYRYIVCIIYITCNENILYIINFNIYKIVIYSLNYIESRDFML